MRSLTDLDFLNGLKVEREILDEDYENEGDKSRSPVKEIPSEEDQEDDDEEKEIARQKDEKRKRYLEESGLVDSSHRMSSSP
jgi:hypothetical protein